MTHTLAMRETNEELPHLSWDWRRCPRERWKRSKSTYRNQTTGKRQQKILIGMENIQIVLTSKQLVTLKEGGGERMQVRINMNRCKEDRGRILNQLKPRFDLRLQHIWGFPGNGTINVTKKLVKTLSEDMRWYEAVHRSFKTVSWGWGYWSCYQWLSSIKLLVY